MTTYWISNICALFNNYNLFPFSSDINENFNAVARLIIFGTIVALFMFEDDSELVLLICGSLLFLSIIVYFLYNRIYVSDVRDNKIKDDKSIEKNTYNTNGYDSLNNVSASTKVTGLKSADYTAIYQKK